jgi:hypothetical protein
MLANAMRAMRLDVDFYNTVEHDTSYTGQAAGVVTVAYLLAGVGAWLGPADNLVVAVVGSVIGGLVGWAVWAALTNIIGGMLGGTADFGEMLRVLGFAQAPIAIGIIPFLDWIGLIWMFVAAVIAVREGLDFSTGKALGTLALGWVVLLIIRLVINFVF